MNEAARMFLVVVGVTTGCGMLLSGVHDLTRQRIATQEVRYVKGPAVKAVLEGADNDPLADRAEFSVADTGVVVFLGKTGGKLTGIALETAAQGYGGRLSVMTGFDPQTGMCKAIAIAGASETPGVGSRISEQSFTSCFKGVACTTTVSLRSAGGTIDGISGATISSKAVCSAVSKAQQLFLAIRIQLQGVDK